MELTTIKTRTPKLSSTHVRGLKLAALALGSSLVLAGCAGNPPTEQYAVTESAVNSAVSAGGTEFAAVEMKSAQDKFKQAEIAMHDKSTMKPSAWPSRPNGMPASPSARPRQPRPRRPCRMPARAFRTYVRKACAALNERRHANPSLRN